MVTYDSSTLLESRTETPCPSLSMLSTLEKSGWNSRRSTPVAPLSAITQFEPCAPPFHRSTPGPLELRTSRSLIVGAQLALRMNMPALSLSGAAALGLPFRSREMSLRIVEGPIMYALKPTTGLSSMSASSICTPLVLTSNAAYPSPGVLASGPPVPRSSRSSKTAL